MHKSFRKAILGTSLFIAIVLLRAGPMRQEAVRR